MAAPETGIACEKRRVGLVYSPHPVFGELAAALTSQLSQLGWDCHDIEDIQAASGDLDLVLLFGDVAMLPWVDEMLDMLRVRNIPTLLWQLEPLPPRPLGETALATTRKLYPVLHGENVFRWNRARRLATRFLSWRLARQTADAFERAHLPLDRYRLQLISRGCQWVQDAHRSGRLSEILAGMWSGAAVLEQTGIQAKFMPVGYHPLFGGIQPSAERDLDVVFFGSLTEARTAILRDVESRLEAAGHKLMVVPGDCYGETRDQLLNRARIVLNLLNYPWEFPSMRLVMAMSCGCLVVSAHGLDPRPFRDGVHLVRAELASLAEPLLHYLENEDERTKLARQGRAFVTSELTMEKR